MIIQGLVAGVLSVGLMVLIGINIVSSIDADGCARVLQDMFDTIVHAIDPTSATASSFGPPDAEIGTDQNYEVYIARDNLQFVGEKINATDSTLNTAITNVTISLAKVNNPLNNVQIVALDSGGSVAHTFGTINASSLTTDLDEYTFNSNYTPSVGDRLGVKYVPETPVTATITSHMSQATQDTSITLRTGVNTIMAEKVVNASSALYNKAVNSISIDMKKTGSPTGLGTAGVFNSTGGLIFKIQDFDVSLLTTSQATYNFYNTASSYTLQSGDYIGFYWSGGDASNFVQVHEKGTTDPFDTTLSIRSRFTGSVWTDNVTNDVTLTVRLITPDTKSRYALSLDGSNDYVQLYKKDFVSNQTSTISGAAFVYPKAYKLENIFGNLRSSTTSGFVFDLTANGTPQVRYYSTIDNSVRTFEMRYPLELNKWHFVGFVANATAGTIRFYADDQIETRVDTITSAIDSGLDSWRIGVRQGGAASEECNCNIDMARLWSGALSDADMEIVRNGGNYTTGLVMAMNFDAGTGTITGDISGNNAFTGTLTNGATWTGNSFPHYVKVGAEKSYLPSFDMTDTYNDHYPQGEKAAWIQNSRNHPEILTTEALDMLRHRGFDVLYVAGVTSTFPLDATQLAWIAQAQASPYNFEVRGVTLESEQFLNDTAWNEAEIRAEIDATVTANPVIDNWEVDIECENISGINFGGYGTDRSACMQYYYNDVLDWVVDQFHSHGKIVGDYQAYQRHADAITAGFTHGINDAPTDYTAVSLYVYTNATAISSFNSVYADDSTGHRLTYGINQRYPARNSPVMPDYETVKFLQSASAWNQTRDEVLGYWSYFYGYEDFGGEQGIRMNVFDKTPLIRERHSYAQTHDGTSFHDWIGKPLDLTMTVLTTGSDSRVNAAKANDGSVTFWESRTNENGVYIYAELNQTYTTINQVALWKLYGHTPSQVQVYISNSNVTWGAVDETATLTDESGLQIITISPTAEGKYVKVQVSTAGSAPSFRLQELDVTWSETLDLGQELVGDPECLDKLNDTKTSAYTIFGISTVLLFFGIFFGLGRLQDMFFS